MKYDVVRARQAVQFLVDSSYFHHHVTKLRGAVHRPRSMPFRGDAEVLNELLVIGRQNPKAMENLIDVAAFKRGDRNEYQKAYMAAKRQRDRKVIELEELLAGKQLSIDMRHKLLLKQYEVWNREREAYLKQQGDIAWVERNEKIRLFWQRKEGEIDALIHEAKTHPVKRKRVVTIEHEPKTEFGRKLVEAVKKPSKPVDRRR